MNSEDQSQDFEKLQRLLKLKRYEQPPPRYFNDFSSRVISHVRAGTSTRRFESANDLISRTPWLRRLWRKLESQPALSGTVAAVACGLMVAGVFFMEETTPQRMNFTAAPEGINPGNDSTTTPLFNNNLTSAAALPLDSSTNVSPLNLFDQMGPNHPGQPVYGRSLLHK